MSWIIVQAKPKYVRNVTGKLFDALADVADGKWNNSQFCIKIELGKELSSP